MNNFRNVHNQWQAFMSSSPGEMRNCTKISELSLSGSAIGLILNHCLLQRWCWWWLEIMTIMTCTNWIFTIWILLHSWLWILGESFLIKTDCILGVTLQNTDAFLLIHYKFFVIKYTLRMTFGLNETRLLNMI